MVSEEVQAAIDDGMAVQRARMHEALARGMPRVGWKVALNDPTVQKRMGIEGSLVGWLNGQAVYPSGATYIEKPGMVYAKNADLLCEMGRCQKIAGDACQSKACQSNADCLSCNGVCFSGVCRVQSQGPTCQTLACVLESDCQNRGYTSCVAGCCR